MSQAPDPLAIDFSRIVSRLERIILAPDPAGELLLRKSSLERSRIGANLEYARTLLFRLEHESSGFKVQSRKQDMQAYLREKRGLLKRLSDRLQELNHLDHGAESSEDVGEDLLGEDEDDGESRSEGLLANGAFAKTTGQTPATDQVSWAQASTATETRGAMRARHAPADLSTNRAKTSSTQLDPALATTEKLFSHNRGEQEDLTASLLNMAQALKASSRAFSSSLDSEKEILNRAGEGLEKNTTGLQAAEKRMGMLRRMTEGRGWWGRMLMYAWIFGLMMIALFIVGFLPKLRF